MDLVKPTPHQVAWADMEFGVFYHFGINTFNNLEWSNGTKNPSSFNPTQLDCEQWVRVAKEAGAKYMVLTCKHHDGFCLWQTDTTDYSVKASPYKNGNGGMEELRAHRTDVALQPAGVPYPIKHSANWKFKVLRPLYMLGDMWKNLHRGGPVANLDTGGLVAWFGFLFLLFALVEGLRALGLFG